MADDTYHGWTNRETWCVALWLNNDSQTLCEEARAVCNQDGEMDQEAAQSLGDWFDDLHPQWIEGGLSGFHADMMNAALSRVNWLEIARSFRE